MKIITSPVAAARFCRKARSPVVLVPTMGALHAGHIALIRRAKKLAGNQGLVVVSIFVNPLQFGPREDLSRYPRPLVADKGICKENGVDLVFAPSAEEMYAPDFSTAVSETSLSGVLCGRSRPGHFQGVCTVVAKLFQIIAPDIAIFGLKDFQQFAIIRRMVRDLNLPVKLVPVETVRELDGLAVSSRNQHLSASERRQAPVIRAALLAAKGGGPRASTLQRAIVKKISSASLARIDYVEIVDAGNLQPVARLRRNTLVAAAVYFGRTRLIDNILIR